MDTRNITIPIQKGTQLFNFFNRNQDNTTANLRSKGTWDYKLHRALWKDCDVETLRYLVSKGVNLNDPENLMGEDDYKYRLTPFHFLCAYKNTEIVLKEAIELGANIKLLTGHGANPLMLYLEEGNFIKSMELAQWSNKKVKDNFGLTATIDSAYNAPTLNVSRMLIDAGDTINHKSRYYMKSFADEREYSAGFHMIFCLVTRFEHFELLEELLKEDIPREITLLNPYFKKFFTPVNWAAEWRNFRALYALLQNGFPYYMQAEIIGPQPIMPHNSGEWEKVLEKLNPQLLKKIKKEINLKNKNEK